jgi:hypothetical protein
LITKKNIIMKEARPLTPLVNSMSPKGVLFGHMSFLAILAVAFYLSWTGGVIIGVLSFFGVGLPWLRTRRMIQEFLRNSSQTAEQQSDTSFSFFHDFAAVSAWVPVFGIFIFHEQFSATLRALRERYESTYWDGTLERAYTESESGHVATFVLWLENVSTPEEKKCTEAIVVLNILFMYYNHQVGMHEKEDADYQRLMEKEDAAIASGNKETVRDFYRVYMSKILSGHDILRRTELLSKKKEIIAIISEVKEMIATGIPIDTCVERFIRLSNRIFFRDQTSC